MNDLALLVAPDGSFKELEPMPSFNAVIDLYFPDGTNTIRGNRLDKEFCFLVDNLGYKKKLQENLLGSWLYYAADGYVHPIFGNLIFFRFQLPDGPCGLSIYDVKYLREKYEDVAKFLHKQRSEGNLK